MNHLPRLVDDNLLRTPASHRVPSPAHSTVTTLPSMPCVRQIVIRDKGPHILVIRARSTLYKYTVLYTHIVHIRERRRQRCEPGPIEASNLRIVICHIPSRLNMHFLLPNVCA